jgi:hypothetical protein
MKCRVRSIAIELFGPTTIFFVSKSFGYPRMHVFYIYSVFGLMGKCSNNYRLYVGNSVAGLLSMIEKKNILFSLIYRIYFYAIALVNFQGTGLENSLATTCIAVMVAIHHTFRACKE